jgi:hypothetical protein
VLESHVPRCAPDAESQLGIRSKSGQPIRDRFAIAGTNDKAGNALFDHIRTEGVV